MNIYETILLDIFLTLIGLPIGSVVLIWSVSYIVDQVIDLLVVKEYSKEIQTLPPSRYDEDITTG